MQKAITFLKTTLLGGVIILLPSLLLWKISVWVFTIIDKEIQPLALQLSGLTGFNALASKALTLALIIGVCFMFGLLVKISLGRFLWQTVENMILRRIPGYAIIKEIVSYFSNDDKNIFGQAVMFSPFGHDTFFTGFVTDEDDLGNVTVFSPTAPNPTTGFVFHLKKEQLVYLDVPSSEAFKSIVACGRGSAKHYNKINSTKKNV